MRAYTSCEVHLTRTGALRYDTEAADDPIVFVSRHCVRAARKNQLSYVMTLRLGQVVQVVRMAPAGAIVNDAVPGVRMRADDEWRRSIARVNREIQRARGRCVVHTCRTDGRPVHGLGAIPFVPWRSRWLPIQRHSCSTGESTGYPVREAEGEKRGSHAILREAVYLGDLYTESGQTLQGSFSAVSTPIFCK